MFPRKLTLLTFLWLFCTFCSKRRSTYSQLFTLFVTSYFEPKTETVTNICEDWSPIYLTYLLNYLLAYLRTYKFTHLLTYLLPYLQVGLRWAQNEAQAIYFSLSLSLWPQATFCVCSCAFMFVFGLGMSCWVFLDVSVYIYLYIYIHTYIYICVCAHVRMFSTCSSPLCSKQKEQKGTQSQRGEPKNNKNNLTPHSNKKNKI